MGRTFPFPECGREGLKTAAASLPRVPPKEPSTGFCRFHHCTTANRWRVVSSRPTWTDWGDGTRQKVAFVATGSLSLVLSRITEFSPVKISRFWVYGGYAG